ncbi:MAG: wax ester/triacylglycerol synthase family O-acyltransferase [Actinomycetota bacterium]|nr:wax ester/triacylglycerol synthase family O-acyltransferase [Actinomycetota bacterium]
MDDRLSPIEAIMWKAGQDPTLRMTVGLMMVLDRAPSYDALVERFAAVIKRSPRLQSRPGDSSFAHARPQWVEDDALGAEHHVRTAAVSRPGTLRQLLDLVGLFEPVPFDPNRAPWDGTLIEGLEGGRAALYMRAHHVVTDGLAGLRLAGRFLDGDEIDLREETAPVRGGRSGIPTIDLTAALRPLQVAVNAVRDPDTVNVIVRGLQQVVDLATSVSRQVVITGGSLSPLLVDESMTTRFEVISVPGARAAALALGGSRNDLLVAAAASGLGLYHERLGVPCDELRLSTPTSQRRGHDVGGNWFAPARVSVPTTAGPDALHFETVADRLTRARMEPALRFAPAMASTMSYLPAQVLIPALHAQARTVDFAATAIPGLRGSGHICGARIETSYPFGPRLGCPVNLTAFGNRDRLDVGIALDPAAITEPAILLECLDDAFARLI